MINRYEDEKWIQSMKLKLDYNNMMDTILKKEGISQQDIKNIESNIEKSKNEIIIKRKNKNLEWMNLPYNQHNVIIEIKNYVDTVKNDFDTFILLGIGGSALGPMAVHQAINHPFYNELPKEKRNNLPKFYVIDNIDPERLSYLFDIINIKKCLFNVISKSGNTTETMSQFMIIIDLLKKQLDNEKYKHNIVITTDSKNGNLIKISKQEGFKTFFIPSGVGGRFSQLTPVGLLPAYFCGIDIEEMLAGAAFMDKICKNDDITKNPAYMYAILNYISMKKGKNICVLMPYADRLKYISDWYAQLWAESLGKKYNLQGQEVNIGPTPLKALGATDQHSQIQLFTEGPFDKIIILLSVDKYKKILEIPKIYQNISSLSFLGGSSQNKLIKIEQISTEYALLKSEKINMTITLPEVNEFTIGQLLYMFEVSTTFMGELMHINAFNQPGVEEVKISTYALLGRPGYENKKLELDSMPQKNPNFII